MANYIHGLTKTPVAAPFDPAALPSMPTPRPFQDILCPSTEKQPPLSPLTGRPRLAPPVEGDHHKILQELVNTNPETRKGNIGETVPNAVRSFEGFQTELNDTYTTVSPSDEGSVYNRLPKNPEQLLLLFLKLQNSLEESLVKIAYGEIEVQQNMQKGIKEEHFNLNKDIEKRNNQSTLLGWVNATATAGVIAVSVALFFATGGATGLLACGLGVLSVVQGTTTIAKAVVDHDKDKKTGQLYDVNAQEREIYRLIDSGLESINETMSQIADIAKMMRTILDQQLQSTKIIFS